MKMHKNTFGMAGLTAAAVIGATLAVSPVAAADDHTTSLVGPGCAAYAAQVPSGPGSVAGLAAGSVTAATANSPLLTTLNAALSGKLNPNVNLVDTLNGGQFTVFAPTNAAFAALPAGTVDTLLKPEKKGTLTGVLTYHVVPGRIDQAALGVICSGATSSIWGVASALMPSSCM